MSKLSKIPSDWKMVRVGDYVISVKGKKPRRVSKERTKECSIPYINIKAFEKNIIDEYTDGVGCALCDDGDFLMVWDGSRSGYVGKAIKGALGSTLVKLNFPDLENNYAYYFLQSKYLEINTRAKGVGIPHVDPNILWNYDLLIPPIETQKEIVSKIGELFSEVDKGIETLRAAQRQLKVYRQAVLKWAFEGKLTEEWRSINKSKTGYDLLKEIASKRTELLKYAILNGDNEASRSLNKVAKHEFRLPSSSDLPNEWLWTSFLTACHYVVDCHNKTAPYQANGIYLIRTSNIKNGRLILDNHIKFVSPETYEFWSKRCKPLPGDILFTREAPMGEAAVIPADTTICMGQRVMLLRTFPDLLNVKYLHYCIMDSKFQERMNENAIGTGVKHLRVGDVEGLSFPLCSFEEQNAIVAELESRLSVADKIEETISQSLQQAEALKQSILKQAFEGKLTSIAKAAARQIPLPRPVIEDPYVRKVFAAYIISRCYNGKHFGKVVFQKILHLAEYHCQCDYEMMYLQKAAGPLDEFINRFIEEAEEKGWFTTQLKNKQVRFEPGANLPQLLLDYQEIFVTENYALQQVLELTKNETLDGAELYSTVYAVWNNCLINNLAPTKERIVKGVYDWSDRKEKFSEVQIWDAKGVLEKKGLVPVGFGKEIKQSTKK